MNQIVLLALILFVSVGCSNSIYNVPKTEEISISSDHKIISSQSIISTGIQKLLEKELDHQQLTSILNRETWVFALQSTLRWPNKLDIKVKEHQPLANWQHKGYLTHSGLIITPQETNLDLVLITLDGPEDKKFSLLKISREIQSQLNRYGSVLSQLNVSSEGYLTATTTLGTSLVFNEKGFRDQLERLEDLISFELFSGKLNNIKKMDFRYNNGVSVLFL